MNDKASTYDTISGWLSLTQDDEIDCDRFAELLAPWLDERIADPKLLQLIEHHHRICAECAEETATLRRALDLDQG